MTSLPLRHAAQILAGQSPDSNAVRALDGGLPFLQGNAEFGRLYPTARWESPSAPKVANEGDILISVRAPVGAVNIADQSYGIGRGLCAVRLRAGSPRYFYWWLMSSSEELNSVATGSTFTAVSASDLGDLRVPISDEVEQAEIAGFLDRETAEIDAFIADQAELVALLTERRAATITRAVTLGLDSAAFMKESGSSWFPTVPDGWVLMPVNLGSTLIQTGPFGSQLHSDEYVDGGVPIINPMHLVDGTIRPSSAASVTSEKAVELRRHVLERGDVVVARRGELGRCAVATAESVGYLCGTGSAIIRLRADVFVPEFFQLVFSSEPARHALLQYSVGSTMDNLNTDVVGALRLPCPSTVEQRSIIDYLDSATAELDAAIADAREAIALSCERRAALISAAVTGKIDVRSAV